ncbi:hydroxymethylglutaryl-CoA lyase [Virgibacillus sp. W0430]|uniref:hydroxymethylglutaryl-CoA lyase n=1 Tax=Virgibacillus sp. W0430 TaxID=3391580 RepID=UPI003F4772FE
MNRKLHIQEVVTRDGFQIEPIFIPTAEKVKLINALSQTGVRKIEVTSFVSPKAVPQLKDAATVFENIERNEHVTYTALVPNVKGAIRAIEAGADEINLVMSVSESHNIKNVQKTTEQSLHEFKEILKMTKGTNIVVNGSLATSFGCPFEGEIPEQRLFHFLQTYVEELELDSVTFADTTGMAHPRQVENRMKKAVEMYPTLPITVHFHNTRGMGLANVIAAINAGITRFDAALGGLGGCPFAPGATGNICTEDLVHMLDAIGYETAVDVDKLIALSKQLPKLIGKDVPGQVVKAGKITDLHPMDE